jgi:hypothetical protein
MKKTDGDIELLFQKIAAKKNWIFFKNSLTNRMNDGLLDDCLIIFIERDIFLNVKEEDITNCFMVISRRRADMNKK